MTVSISRERPYTAEHGLASRRPASSSPDSKAPKDSEPTTVFGVPGLDEPDADTAHALRLGYIKLDHSGITVYLDVPFS